MLILNMNRVLYIYIGTFGSMCAVPNMAVLSRYYYYYYYYYYSRYTVIQCSLLCYTCNTNLLQI